MKTDFHTFHLHNVGCVIQKKVSYLISMIFTHLALSMSMSLFHSFSYQKQTAPFPI